jgi:chaperonin cofactor prefoldin
MLETKISNVDSARNAIQAEFTVVSAKADSLTQNNLQLQGSLAERSTEIQTLKGNISSILRKKNATAAELTDAKKMINELNGKINGLFVEIEKLKGENQELTTSNQQLNTDKTQLTTDKQNLETNLTKTNTEKQQLADKVDVASTLEANNIGILAINLKNSGKEKETNTAKRADYMRVVFSVDANRVTPTGAKEFYVVISGPDGKVFNEGGKFTTREDGEKEFTNKVVVPYEQGKPMPPVSFNWKKSDKFVEGDYKIAIYNNGFKIGEGVKTLKKGGLFS